MAEAPGSTGIAAQPTLVCSRRDRAALPARPLGPKARLRRQRRSRRWTPAPRVPGTTVLSSEDRNITCMLRRRADGITVQRCEYSNDTLLELHMAFTTAAAYEAWCNADVLRKSAPDLHRKLRLYGEEHFDGVP